MQTTTGRLYAISAPSGAGKTTLVNGLVEQMDTLTVSVSHTTRPKRAGEKHGVNYFFIEVAPFLEMAKEEAFLEHAEVFGHHYGTSRKMVEAQLQRGKDVILEIDWQGMRQIKTTGQAFESIFILPPSKAALEQRLIHRARDTQSVIEDRMKQATSEISHYDEYDYLVANDDFNTALSDLKSIIKSKRLLRANQKKVLSELISSLLT